MREELVEKFWTLMSNGSFYEIGELMQEDAQVCLANTREIFRDRDKFVAFNNQYPGRWMITIEELMSKGDKVISIVKVEAEDKSGSFYATSVFTIKEDLISNITEYWGDNGEPPEWRQNDALSERY